MGEKRGIKKTLAILLPAGVLGISAALAATLAGMLPSEKTLPEDGLSIAERLHDIRSGVSSVDADAPKTTGPDGEVLLAQWANIGIGGGGFGWRNGGWGNGGWHNWGNGGWHNWGNGGWHNWGNAGGWHNWHNFWHNW